jgi:hypothetical protein
MNARVPVRAAQFMTVLARTARGARSAPRRTHMLSDWMTLHAPGPSELSGLEAFLAEDGPSLRWPERHCRLFSTCGARGRCLYPFPGDRPTSRTTGALAFAGLAALRLVLEVLVGEKLLLPGRPDKLCATVHAPEYPVLELHRSLPRRVGRFLAVAAGRSAFVVSAPVVPTGYSNSRRSFLRLRFRASACLARRLSPGFK